MTIKGKRLIKANEGINRLQDYPLDQAVRMLKERAATKFDETLEIAINLGIDPRHSDQNVRGMISLPNGTGKTVRVAVFAKGDKADEAREAGADLVGAEDLMEQIQGGVINFDLVIASPDMMPLVGRLGKILGPRGLMPNPKLGTVTPNLIQAIELAKAGQVQFRAERAGIIHAGIGKVSFDAPLLIENACTFVNAIIAAKPTSAKGSYMKKITLSSTMGPSIRIDLSTVYGTAGGGSVVSVS